MSLLAPLSLSAPALVSPIVGLSGAFRTPPAPTVRKIPAIAAPGIPSMAAPKADTELGGLQKGVEQISTAKDEAGRRQVLEPMFTGSRARAGASEAGTSVSAESAGIETSQVNPSALTRGPPQGSRRRVTFVYDAGTRQDISGVRLKGSFDKKTGAYGADLWMDSLPMTPAGDGKWTRTVDLADDGAPHDWRWSVALETPRGSQEGVVEEEPLPISLDAETAYYAPTTYHVMGAHRQGSDDLAFRLWAPGASEISVKIVDRTTLQERRIPLSREKDRLWSAVLSGQWKRSQGDAYIYEIKAPDGSMQERADPYARAMQGKQRGISHLYVDAETGAQVDPYHFRNAKRQQLALAMFEIQERRGERLSEAYLIFKDENGRPLEKRELAAKLGVLAPAFAAKLRGGRFDEYWAKNVSDDGRIRMTYEEGAWITLVNNPEKLAGLRYELQAFKGPVHLPRSAKNDPWSDLIGPESGKSFRAGVIADDHFDWKWDSAPREKNPNRGLIYQMHVGSVFGGALNSRRSTFDDIRRELGYVNELGYNTIEFLPIGEHDDIREWGYGSVGSLAVESSYGYEDEDGRWVSGMEALKRLVDEAHREGLVVLGDVVYNHIGGKYDDQWQVSATDGNDRMLWRFDGKANSYLNWSGDPERPEIKMLGWGPVEAFNNPGVRRYLRDHFGYQLQELHFDGERFDFTDPIKRGDAGGADGWFLLRLMNRLARLFNPDATTSAEQFPYDPSMTQPQATGGAGFTQTWFTEFNHRLVHESDPSRPSIIQEAARGAKTIMDRFMDLLIRPFGIGGWGAAVAPVTNHDEIAAGDRVINIAGNGRAEGLPSQAARNRARFALGLGLAGPGVHMIFSGEEFMADNRFQWGNPSTWDMDWSWRELGKDWDWKTIRFNDRMQGTFERLLLLSPGQRASDGEYAGLSKSERSLLNHLASTPGDARAKVLHDAARRLHFEFTKAAVALRKSSPAFDADAPVARVYTHNDDSVLAFTRARGGDEFLVVGSLNRGNLSGYRMDLPPGQWKEVFNSDAETFGGSGFGNGGRTLPGGPAAVNIPSMGYVVFKKTAS